jgi:hypothetical protein
MCPIYYLDSDWITCWSARGNNDKMSDSAYSIIGSPINGKKICMIDPIENIDLEILCLVQHYFSANLDDASSHVTLDLLVN